MSEPQKPRKKKVPPARIGLLAIAAIVVLYFAVTALVGMLGS